MPEPALGQVTQLLAALSAGHREVLPELIPMVYGELRTIAGRFLRRERPDHTLDATALVHEAYLRLVDQRDVQWQHRAHFFGVAAQMMRRILVDHARKRAAAKRVDARGRVALETAFLPADKPPVDIIALDGALARLADFDPPQSRIVELRFFGGLTIEETAEVVGISPATVKREWTMAKAWLRREIEA